MSVHQRTDEPTLAELEDGGSARALQDVKRDMYKLLATTPDPNALLATSVLKRSRHAAVLSDDEDSQSSAGGMTKPDVSGVVSSAPALSARFRCPLVFRHRELKSAAPRFNR